MKRFIYCPNCNAEYLPSEIFLPNEFLGKAHDVERDVNGKILYQENGEMGVEENYICDKCNKPFRIIAKVSFITAPDAKLDFDAEYSSSLKKNVLFMKES